MRLTEIKGVDKYSNYLNILGICLNVVSGFLFLFMLRKLYWHAFGDEGFILLGYQKEQVLSPSLLNESFLIVRRLLPFLNEDPIIQLRIINFTLIFVGLLLFTLISAKWFKYRYENKLNLWVLSGIFFISGLICCPSALPTLHYNSIQTILFLFIYSFFLLFDLAKPSLCKGLNAFLCGFLSLFAIFNYLSSGLCLLFILFVLIFAIFNKGELKIFLSIFAFGFISGLIFYHFFVHNLFSYFSDLFIVFSGKSINYIPSSLLEFITQTLIYYTPLVILYSVVQIQYFKFRLVFVKYVLPITISLVVFFLRFNTSIFRNNLVFLLLIVFLAIYYVVQFKYERYFANFIFILSFCIIIALLYEFYRSLSYYLIFLPWLLVLTDIILLDSKLLTKKRLIILLTVASLPVLCVLGTDCKLYEKISMFSPIYAFLFFLLILWNKKNVNSYRFIFYIFVFVSIHLFLHNISGFYGFQNAEFNNENGEGHVRNAERQKDIIFSGYDKARIEESIDILTKNGFKKGDEILSVSLNYATVYIAGGYSAKPFTYGHGQFQTDDKRGYLPNYIIIKESQKDGFTRFADKYFHINTDKDYYIYPVKSTVEWIPNESVLIYCKK